MSQVFCEDCKKNLPATAPRIIHTDYARNYSYYVCGDCEYLRERARDTMRERYNGVLTEGVSPSLSGLDPNGDAIQ